MMQVIALQQGIVCLGRFRLLYNGKVSPSQF
jgi:hypothetical protein